jgi:hypothetical protein
VVGLGVISAKSSQTLDPIHLGIHTPHSLLSHLLPGQTDVFVHVEGNNVLEAKLARLEELDKLLVCTNRRRTSGKTENKRTFSRRLELVNTLLHIVG